MNSTRGKKYRKISLILILVPVIIYLTFILCGNLSNDYLPYYRASLILLMVSPLFFMVSVFFAIKSIRQSKEGRKTSAYILAGTSGSLALFMIAFWIIIYVCR